MINYLEISMLAGIYVLILVAICTMLGCTAIHLVERDKLHVDLKPRP